VDATLLNWQSDADATELVENISRIQASRLAPIAILEINRGSLPLFLAFCMNSPELDLG
jgi:hypothetical protein